MPIETVIENLVISITKLTAAIESLNAKTERSSPVAVPHNPSAGSAGSPSLFDSPAAAVPVRSVETPVQAPVQAAPVPQPVAPVPAPVVQMPAPPTFAPPAPAPVAVPTSAPFSDPKGLIDYVMSSYKAMGPEKGGRIQSVLTGLGYQNINDVRPEHYGALYAGIEGLK